MRLSLNDTVSKYYDKIDNGVIELKGGFMGICAEIDRYFKLAFGIDLSGSVSFIPSVSLQEIFPNLSSMSCAQFEQLRILYCEIRNINAHLFLCRPIHISSDLVDYFTNIAKPDYSVAQNNELTMYGMLYVLTFMSHKYQLWPFLSECFKSKYFSDFTRKETSQFQTRTQHALQEFCGLGKPIFPNGNISKIDIQYFNDTCKRYMTKIFFSLEKSILGWSLSSTKMPQFGYLLNNNPPFSEDKTVTGDLVRLRNYWFHGKAVFDRVNDYRERFVFSLEYIVSVFIKLKRVLQGSEKYTHTVQLIEQFGEKLVHFYLLRIVEVSYKLLDNRLLTEDKVDSRILDINRAVLRFEEAQPEYFEAAIRLIDNNDISFNVGASKFLDFIPRTTKSQLLQIIKVKSKRCISIGQYQSAQNEVCLAVVDLENEYLNSINGYSLREMQGTSETYYSPRICVKNIELE